MKVNLAIPAMFGGGSESGDCMESELGNFLSRFNAEDVRAFAQGYWDYRKRKEMAKPQPSQRVAMVKPTTTMATVTAQKATAKPAPSKDDVWKAILTRVGSGDAAKIDAFLQTSEGREWHGMYQNASPHKSAFAEYPQRQVAESPTAKRIEALARREQRHGESYEQAYDRVLREHPELYAQYRREATA